MEGRLHKVQEDGYLKNRDDADKFNLAMDDENIDFNISVKRSQSISVHDLIQKIESHPQKEAVEESYPTPHIHEQMTTSNYGYDTAYNFTQNNIMLEPNAMNNIDIVAHMNVHNTQY